MIYEKFVLFITEFITGSHQEALEGEEMGGMGARTLNRNTRESKVAQVLTETLTETAMDSLCSLNLIESIFFSIPKIYI